MMGLTGQGSISVCMYGVGRGCGRSTYVGGRGEKEESQSESKAEIGRQLRLTTHTFHDVTMYVHTPCSIQTHTHTHIHEQKHATPTQKKAPCQEKERKG